MNKHSKVKVEIEINKFNAINLFIANLNTLSDEHIREIIEGPLAKFMGEIWGQMIEQGVDMVGFAEEHIEQFHRYAEQKEKERN